MAGLFGRPAARVSTLSSLGVPDRRRLGRGAPVTVDSAMQHSVVWACLRLRADLISTMPVDVFRAVPSEGIEVEVPKPPVLIEPASHGEGQPMDITEWLYSSQVDLDRYGNAVGVITQRDAVGLPREIQPVPAGSVAVIVRDDRIVSYRICNVEYDPRDIWHERQFTAAGLHVGLSPIAYAALTLGAYSSGQEFLRDWFGGGGVPSSILRNTTQTLTAESAATIKSRFTAAMEDGGLFVTGKDWDYEMVGAPEASSAFLSAMNASMGDIGRFLGVPGDLVDVAVSTGSITYASITQRNLQLLIMNLGPAIVRRERALSRLTARPRHVKLNSDALLRMDPSSRGALFAQQVASRTRAPSEVRALDNLPPYTDEQLAEFDQLFGSRAPAAAKPATNS